MLKFYGEKAWSDLSDRVRKTMVLYMIAIILNSSALRTGETKKEKVAVKELVESAKCVTKKSRNMINPFVVNIRNELQQQ